MIIDRPNERDITSLRALWKEAFGDSDEFLDIFFRTAFSPDRCRMLTTDGKTASALYWFDCICEDEPIAYIYSVATAESHRGKGLCSSLMTDTHAHLASRGYSGALLSPASDSLFTFYERLEYKICTYIHKFTCTASKESVRLTPLCSAEYNELRRKLLPCGGVIQENENTDFLITQEELYKGENFIIAARREKDTLVCAEILGDISSSPMITNALGCKSGNFRTPPIPGKPSCPFTMYRPFTTAPSPLYFGLAFD